MQNTYTAWLSRYNGDRIQPIEDFVSGDGASLLYSRAVNAITPLTLTIPLTTEYQTLFRDPTQWLDQRIEIWRKPLDGAERLETETIWWIRNVKKNLTKNYITLTAYSANELLARRQIAYKVSTSQSQHTDAIDDIMRAIVRENFVSATDSARNISLLIVSNDLGQGVSITKQASFKTVLDVLQELSAQSFTQGTTPIPILFDVVGIINSAGINNLSFQTYKNQRGDDRTSGSNLYAVTLSENTNTLTNVEIEYAYDNEVNYVYVGGPGEEAIRTIETVYATPRITTSAINRREGFHPFTDISATAAILQSEGYKKLREGRPKKIITAAIRNNETIAYGRDYAFGDRLTAEIDGSVFDVRIDTITVDIRANKETISASIHGEL